MSYLLAIDQGTSSSRAVVYDANVQPVASAQQEFPQIYPQPGWVEQDPETLWQDTVCVARAAMGQVPNALQRIAAIGTKQHGSGTGGALI